MYSYVVVRAQGAWGDDTVQRVDETTFTDIPEWPVARIGKNRFASKEGILKLYALFDEPELNYSIRRFGGAPHEVRNWVVTRRKWQ